MGSEQRYTVAYRGERFDTFAMACNAYGLSTKYVQKFIEVGKTHAEALNNALHCRDIKLFYGLIIYPYKISGSIDVTETDDLERCSRIMKVQNARVEKFDFERHCIVLKKFAICITKLQTLVDRLKYV